MSSRPLGRRCTLEVIVINPAAGPAPQHHTIPTISIDDEIFLLGETIQIEGGLIHGHQPGLEKESVIIILVRLAHTTTDVTVMTAVIMEVDPGLGLPLVAQASTMFLLEKSVFMFKRPSIFTASFLPTVQIPRP